MVDEGVLVGERLLRHVGTRQLADRRVDIGEVDFDDAVEVRGGERSGGGQPLGGLAVGVELVIIVGRD